MRKKDRATVSVFGDASTVTWIYGENWDKIGLGDFGTDGEKGHNLAVESGGSASPLISLHGRMEGIDEESMSLYMNGRAILEFILARVPDSAARCMAKNQVSEKDIDIFAFHQASHYMLKQIMRFMSLPSEKVPIRLEETGNTVSSSIPLVLEQLLNEGLLDGKKVLVSGFGVGLSCATNIIQF
jgi:3-oxoacyl-[acyl-carrier-protein] synthase-3